MMKNKKAASTALYAIAFIAIIVIIVVVAASLGSGPAAETNNKDITVYIEGVKQTGNYSEPQTLNWGTISASHTYTRNFTCANSGTQPYSILLLTTEPAGTTQKWSFNNTVLAAGTYSEASLTLELSANPTSGIYTWRLLTSNNTIPDVTATPGPSASPAPVACQVTLNAPVEGINNFNVTVNADKFAFTTATLPNTLFYHSGDTLTFRTEAATGYTFNYWVVDGIPTAGGTNPYIINDAVGNFTIAPTFILNSPS